MVQEYQVVKLEIPIEVYNVAVDVSEQSGIPLNDLIAGAVCIALAKPKAGVLSRIARLAATWRIDRIKHLYYKPRKTNGDSTPE